MTDIPTTGASMPDDAEPDEPGAMIGKSAGGLESPPMWLWALIFIAIVSGVYFLGANLGNIGSEPWPESSGVPAVTVATQPSVDGGAVYMTRCVACHQANGQGVPAVFPPLAGSEWATGDPDNVIRIVLLGIQGPIDVAGATYNSVMPGLAAQMVDEDIAAVITHVRSSFGNSASAVSSADVSRIRAELQGRTQPWEASELSAMPAAAPTPSTPAPTPAQTAPQPVQTASTSGSTDGSALFSKYACNTCHSVDDPTPLVGPSLFNVGNRLSRGEIYQSIVDPDAQIAEGYAAGMMSAMVGTLNISGSELKSLVDYLASLKG